MASGRRDEPVPLGRATFDAATLMATSPPRFVHPNKQAVYALACPPGAVHRGTLVYSRWREQPLPAAVPSGDDAGTAFTMREDIFAYETPAPNELPVVEWYVNFAHTVLFVAYGGPLFAQDEMQVAEHPALGALREALKETPEPGLRPVTREGGVATPVLIRGVERRVAIATDPDADQDRPLGLYGNRFARARVTAVRAATRVLTPPTITHVIAMEAPPGGTGRYTAAQVRDIVATAATGFAAARVESAEAAGSAVSVVVHTGHWGTGAYGGDRVLMALLQMVAARLAGVNRLVYHTVDAAGSAAWRDAHNRLATGLLTPERPLADVLDAIVAMGFAWGVSDGN